MRPFKKLLSSALLAFAACTSPVFATTFIENDGIVMMEAESSGTAGDWELERAIGGFTGNGYLRWDGSDAFDVNSAGRGTITYRFRIERAGNYELLWRSRITRGNSNSEHNDSWARFPTGRNVAGEQPLNGWTKIFMNTQNQWAWRSRTVDNVARPVRQFFSAGDHTMQISGRSNGHAIDRISLYDYSDNSIDTNNFTSLPVSRTTNESAPNPAPESAPTPVAPTPAPEPTPLPAMTEAPIPVVSGDVLAWSAVDAIAINVHRGNGAWLESLPGSVTQWQAPAEGSYYLVATNEQSWQAWGRSETVTVGATSERGGNDSALQLSAQVYSDTALELFWVSNDVNALTFEVRRENQLLTTNDGRSYFDNTIQGARQYNYTVTGVNAAGNAVVTDSVSVSIDGTPAESSPAVTGGLNLSAQAYSQSAIELFWSTDQLASNVNYQFEIYQNSVLLDTTDGRSFFRDNLTAGTANEFFVIALDGAGVAVLTESIVVTTRAADTP